MSEFGPSGDVPTVRYSSGFYQARLEGVRRSAQVIVPLVLEFVQPRSVVDIGCGPGTWLTAFHKHGVEDVWGVDVEDIDKTLLEIPEEHFLNANLELPFAMDRRCDLVVSLEVAEHLPSPCADTFVTSLTSLGPVVLFSAAIPSQQGAHHVNEQWLPYWCSRFEERAYVGVDCIRRKIWTNENVSWWYAQNCLIFVQRERLPDYPLLLREFEFAGTAPLALVHPKRYMLWVDAALRHQDEAQKGEP